MSDVPCIHLLACNWSISTCMTVVTPWILASPSKHRSVCVCVCLHLCTHTHTSHTSHTHIHTSHIATYLPSVVSPSSLPHPSLHQPHHHHLHPQHHPPPLSAHPACLHFCLSVWVQQPSAETLQFYQLPSVLLAVTSLALQQLRTSWEGLQREEEMTWRRISLLKENIKQSWWIAKQ